MRKFVTISIWLCVAPIMVAAQKPELKIPLEVAPFVETGTKALALEYASAYLDMVQSVAKRASSTEGSEAQRALVDLRRILSL